MAADTHHTLHHHQPPKTLTRNPRRPSIPPPHTKFRRRTQGEPANSTPLLLALDDLWALGIVNTFDWGCSTTRYLLPLFCFQMRNNHLDVGVGTGHHLDKGNIPPTTRLILIDNEPGALDVAKKRSKRPDANVIIVDILRPLPTREKFDSVGIYSLFHCLRVSVQEKCSIFNRLKWNMTPDRVIHGANVLEKGVHRIEKGQKWNRSHPSPFL